MLKVDNRSAPDSDRQKSDADLAIVQKSNIQMRDYDKLPAQQKYEDEGTKQIKNRCPLLQRQKRNFLYMLAFITFLLILCTLAPENQIAPENQMELLQYISEPRVQKGGNVSVSNTQKVWTVDLSYLNKNAKGLAEALYPDPKVLNQRQIFHYKRFDFVSQKSRSFPGINMMKYNMRINDEFDSLCKMQQEEDYNRLEEQFHLSQVKVEMPVCLVVRTYNNNAQFRVEYNLNSIFTQNYTNYFVVMINDASNDGTDNIIRRYFHFFQIPKEKYVYISHKTRNTALENTYRAINNICSDDSIVLVLDGDDEILGRNAFKTFNREHQRLGGGWIYTNHYQYMHQKTIGKGFSRAYSLEQKKPVAFRQIITLQNSHFRSFPARAFKKVPEEYFKNEKGLFYKRAEDIAIFVPTSELVCGHVYFLDTVNYIYNFNTGINDWIVSKDDLVANDKSIRAKKKLDCLPEFRDRPIIV